MNREQRRKYARALKNDTRASICPRCNNKSLFISKKNDNEETAIVCECCGQTIIQNERITKSIPPGIYLPFAISDLEKIMTIAEEMEKEKKEND